MATNSAKHDPLRTASKFISLVLRHDPAAAGVTLDAHGWVDIDELLNGMANAGQHITRDELDRIVNEDTKTRYSIDNNKIRANQGHSIPVDLGLAPSTPPPVLFHGTAQRFLASILATGLNPGERQHVHLSHDRATAVTVGRRHGQPIVLRIDASRLATDGQPFFLSDNNVWLTTHIESDYLSLDDDQAPGPR